MPSLFARLRPAPLPSSAAYDAAVNVARAPHWYRAGEVPDTMDGRFAVLATVLALVTLRLEEDGALANTASVGLTETFIGDMDAQMREAGFGDPSLGKQVRSLVGSLASRLDRWRRLFAGENTWEETVRRSLYGETTPSPAALAHSIEECRAFRERLTSMDINAVIAGHWT